MVAWRLRWRVLARRWHDFRDTIWFVPGLLTFGGVALFILTTWIDRSGWLAPEAANLPFWTSLMFFAGSAGSAQTLLATVAGMWATVIGISFSIMLVTTQLTATKYVAQVLPLFERDRVNQVVLGSFLATVLYSLLVLRTVREEPPVFVPYLGTSVAIVLAASALFLLIAFISNNINLVRPQFFLTHTLRATCEALETAYPPERDSDLVPLDPHEVPAVPPPTAEMIRSDCQGMLAGIDWEALCMIAREDFRRERGRGGRWVLYFHNQVGEIVSRGEPLAFLVRPEGSTCGGRFAEWIRQCHEVRTLRRYTDDPDYGIESLSGITIKGAVQGDLDVAFEGVDHLFTLLPLVAAMPAPAGVLRFREGDNELVVVRPVTDLLGKIVRELNLINELALAPGLPFRPLTEGIGTRFCERLGELADNGDWEAFHRLLGHLGPWYESAFYHLDWVHGMRHLAMDLARTAIAVRRYDHPGAFEGLLNLLLTVRDRMGSDAQAHEALQEAFAYIAQEADLPLMPVMWLSELGEPAPDTGQAP